MSKVIELRTIRRARSEDFEQIINLFKQSVREVSGNDYTKRQIDAWLSGANNREKWLRRIQEQYFICCVEMDSVIGFGSLDLTGYFDVLYVDSNHQRKGVARMIWNELLNYATTNNIIELTTHASITAFPFFSKIGFEEIAANEVEIDGVLLRNYSMKYVVNNATK